MLPKLSDMSDIFFNEEKCIEFLIKENIFTKTRICPKCQKNMKLEIKHMRFRCGKKSCRKNVSLRYDTFFEGHKLQCSQILLLAYLWLSKMPTKSIIEMSKCSSRTVCSFTDIFRNLISKSLECEDTIIGGEDIIVEVDETKIGRRKYHRGHNVEGAWVLGGIEHTEEKKIFLVNIPDRSMKTINNLLVKYVKPGSVIYTDLWKGYNGLNSIGFGHEKVNHSITYKDPISGVHTNTIEGIWNGVKMLIKPRNRNGRNIQDHLFECIWRRKNKTRLWESFLHTITSYGQ